MDPQVKSALTSILMTLAGSAATWGVSVGLVPAADKSSAANIIATLVLAALTALIGWWKTRAGSPTGIANTIAKSDPATLAKAVEKTDQTAIIKVVNTADNGRKVVDVSSPSPAVDTSSVGVKP